MSKKDDSGYQEKHVHFEENILILLTRLRLHLLQLDDGLKVNFRRGGHLSLLQRYYV